MKVQDLRDLLASTQDKLSVFEDKTNLNNCDDLSNTNLLNLIADFLDDEQKANLFSIEHFKGLNDSLKFKITQLISDNNVKLGLLKDPKFVSGFEDYQIKSMVESLGDNGKQDLLSDKTYVEQSLHLNEYQIPNIVSSISSEKIKLDFIDLYKFNSFQIIDILETFSDKSKTSILLENKYGFSSNNLSILASSLSPDSLLDFFKNNRSFLDNNNISPYSITRKLDWKGQIAFISNFEDIGLSLDEKRQILATLSKEAKDKIDISNFPPEYISAIEMKISETINYQYGKIIINLNDNLEKYSGLDELIAVNCMEISDNDIPKLMELCSICPNISIYDNIGLAPSTTQEYKNGEAWIGKVMSGINPDWTNIQKVAYIDNAIGKKISYSPDFDTEVFDAEEARALWKIIDSGYGVCNGISQVEKYILDRVGIESELVSSGRHAFLKLKNITLPAEDGKLLTGDTILDPTWNLTNHRFGAKPENFCRSYTEIRKHDIKDDGTDSESHKNDEKLESATLDLDEKSLRQIFASIEIADRNGDFPIKHLIDKAKSIDDYNLPEGESIKRQFEALSEYYPEFTTCQNSTLAVLQSIILNQQNLKFNRCIASRVYEKSDLNQVPILYVYVDCPKEGKKFYFADKETNCFLELPQKDFEARFECYEMDMEKYDGHRPWEDVEVEKEENLNQSSGKIIADKGDER